ncbi:tyrosine-type recombinase/integrase [Ruegeria sp. HKCCD6228]|uniref:Tyrosine-type recombinase/integrase n=1 Tax=Ruegeria atlantica TaxID=81569 RepID=A0AA90ZFV1_9RHOB|nr:MULTISPECIES: tyrosine-type recombinase/integrase [Ruegeria]NOC85911.1 tyrosine-type recombinase/integrase [Ruegeria sp. HKCCD6428]NOC94488.1 tyrosine-type recombinase/integrase [Ruegeria sp. HKCCD6604]NOD99800.1 tyrosine-type recombinase/integrase [Ruegeria sp. HKCCD6228]NOE18389.1 tyrosine-type recombinase/integrase [Ruegeria atlantica]
MSLVLPLSAWPVQDREMWLNLQIEGGPLDDCGALSHLRATSLKTLELRYARWLQWLINSNAKAITLPPARRATLPRLSAWLRDLSHTRPMTRFMFIDGVLRILSAADQTQDWSAQRRLKAGLKRTAGRGDRDRKLGRVLSSEVLFKAGMSLATGHAEAEPTPLRRMICLRDGSMIAMMALMPMRRRAFAGLRIGISLHVTTNTMTVALPGDLTKSGQPWEADVPQSVEPLLRRYVNEARPFLMERGQQQHDVLWVGRTGAPLKQDALSPRIAEQTLKLTGRRIPPHFFRDAAATTLARSSPEHAKLIRPILAHASFGTAERHYIHAQTIEAGRDYAALIDLKRKTRR